MNGKDYIIEAMNLADAVLASVRKANLLDGDPLLEGTVKACEGLGYAKNKATLRTKSGANLAFPVYHAAQNLEESWEETGEGDDTGELRERMEEFISCAEALAAALKERTVIMT
jgi:hypothetical protein